MHKTCIKNSACPLGGCNCSKEELWVSIGQLAAKLKAVKAGGQKKILPPPRRGETGLDWAERQNFF